jgi:phosphate starvation-inducible PhoH-like protein
MAPPVTDRAVEGVRRTLVIDDGTSMVGLLGPRDEHLRTIERGLPRLEVHARGNEITLSGSPSDVGLAERLLDEMITVLGVGQPLTADAVERALAMLRDDPVGRSEGPATVLTANILSSRGRTIRPKTLGQKRYVDAIDSHTIVFGIGPAGTGKTYLAMAKAVSALQAKLVNRIVLTRPAVEAGERLGFLPGTLTDKIDPYLRPLYDALHDMLDPESIPRLITAGTIEVAPLAYMRGRAQPYGAQVMTPLGWRPIGSLRAGDRVTGSDGQPTSVLGVHPQGRRQVYRVSTQDGASTLACGEHLWSVRTASDRRRGGHRVLQTHQMMRNLRTGHGYRYELPLTGPVQMTRRPVPLDPYTLGLLLGGGRPPTATAPWSTTADPALADLLGSARADVTIGDTDGRDHVRRAHRARRGGVMVADPVTAAVRDLERAGTRSTVVPSRYLINSVDVRLGVLQGLLDTDGGPDGQAGRGGRIQYSTASPRLADDVAFLVRSLGGVAQVRTQRAQGRPPGRGDGRRVSPRRDARVLDIRLPAGIAPFRLRRKRAAYERHPPDRPARFIHRIEPVGEHDTVCIQVGAADSLYVTDDFLVTHNTLNDAFVILDEAQNTSADQMKMFLTRLGFGSRMVVTGDVTQVDLPSGTQSGLRVVSEILTDVEDVAFCRLSPEDVVRHRLVSDIVAAYDRWDARRGVTDDQRPDPRRSEPKRRGARRPLRET